MSGKQVDERVVSMQFDNRHFEKNVSQSMSTLDKFKQKLHLDGATKGLENIDQASRKVDLSHIGNSVETVRMKFSAFEVMAVTALTRISNAAINMATNFANTLFVAPISDGWNEYEMTLNAVQTTMAGTGKTAEEVEKELKKLDEYADKTVYSTSDMLNNLPKFTNAGVLLEDATKAMIGIANATALAGGDAGKASIAFYNLGQAIGTGYLTRMDYNSINNAGIATMEWKKQMVQAAIAAGTLKKAGEDAYIAGGKTFTLQQLFIDGLQHQWATTDVMMKVFGDYGDEQTKIGEKAYAAAQDIKTFSMMMDSLKATAGTGWKDTWQIIFGNLDAAKEFWTGLSNFISGIVTKMADFRNNLLKGALSFEPWKDLVGSVVEKFENSAFGKTIDKAEKAAESVGKVVDSLEKYQDIVNKVWRGDYNNRGDNPDRFDLLEKAGYNPKVVQNLVNLGYKHKITEEDVAEAHKKAGVEMVKSTEAAKKNAEATETATGSTDKFEQALDKLTDKELEDLGFKKDEIKMLRELHAESKRLGIPMTELLDKMKEMDGRTALIEALKNAASGVVGVFKAMKDAWLEIFPPMSAVRLYSIISGIHEFSKRLRLTNAETGELTETGKNLMRTFKGIFALVDIVATILGGALHIAFKIVLQLLDAFSIDIFEATAYIGDALVAFRDWIDTVLDFTAAFEAVSGPVKEAVKSIKEWIEELKSSDNLARDIPIGIAKGLVAGMKLVGQVIWELCKDVWRKVSGFFASNSGEKIGGDIVSGLAQGLWEGIKIVGEAMLNLGKKILDTICTFLGIHSPAKKLIEVGRYIIEGLIEGLDELAPLVVEMMKTVGKSVIEGITTVVKDSFPMLWDLITGLGQTLINIITSIDLKTVIAATIGVGLFIGFMKVLAIVKDFSSAFSRTFDSVGDLFDSVKRNFDTIAQSFKDVSNAIVQDIRANTFKKIASALLMLSVSIFILAKIDTGKLWSAIGAMAVLVAMLAGLYIMADKLENMDKIKDFKFPSTTLISLGIALLAIAGVLKILSGIDVGKMWISIGALAVMMASLAGLMTSMGVFIKGKTAQNIKKVGAMLRSLAVTMLLMTLVVKLISMMEPGEIVKGVLGIGAFTLIIAGLIAASKLAGKRLDAIGSMLFKISAAMVLMVGAVKLASMMETNDIIKGVAVIVAFSGIIVGLIAATKLAGPDTITKIGSAMAGIGGAMVLMAATIWILSGIKVGDIVKGVVCIAAFAGIITGLIAATKWAGPDAVKAGLTLVLVSACIGVLAAVIMALSLMDMGGLLKGFVIIGLLSAVLAGLVKATKGVGDCMRNLIVLTVAIGVMSLAIAGLSFIKTSKLAAATLAMSAVIGMFALLIKSTATVPQAIGTLVTMTVALGLMGGLIYLLSTMPVERTLGSAAALSTLLLSLAGSLWILGKIDNLMGKAAIGVLLLLELLVPVAAMVGVLALMGNVKNGIENAILLSAFTLALSLCLLLLAGVGALAGPAALGVLVLYELMPALAAMVGILAMMQHVKNATKNTVLLSAFTLVLSVCLLGLSAVGALAPFAALGVLALTLMAVPLLAFVGIIALMSKVDVASENVKLLIGLVTVLGGMLVLLAPMAPLAIAAVTALSMLTGLVLVIAGLAIGIAALMKKFPAIQDFLDTGIPVLIKLFNDVGRMIGAFVSGIAAEATSCLPEIGTNLSDFMNNMKAFIDGAKKIDESVLVGTGILFGVMAALTYMRYIDGFADFVTNGNSLADFGTTMSDFMKNADGFITGAASLDPASLAGAKCLAEIILILTAADILNGLYSWLTGGASLTEFAQELKPFGDAMVEFSNAVSGKIDTEAVTAAANAGKVLAEMAATIPNMGGVIGMFMGENNISQFGQMLFVFGVNIAKFSEAVKGKIDQEAVTAAANAGKTMVELAKTLPQSGGVLGFFMGNNDIDEFGRQLVVFGNAMVNFSDTVTGKIDQEAVTAAANAGQTMVALAKTIPETWGIVDLFTGTNDLATFSTQIVYFGAGIAAFSRSVSGIDMEAVTAATNAGKTMAALASSLPNSGGLKSLWSGQQNLSMLGIQMAAFGGYVATYSKKVSKIDTTKLSTTTSEIKKLADMIGGLSGINFEGLSTFSNSLSKIGTGAVDKLIKAFTNANGRASKAGGTLILKLKSGAEEKKTTLTKALKSIVTSAADAVSKLSSEFTSAGKDLGDGLVTGIKAKEEAVRNAGYALGQKAVQGEKDGQQSESPSKLTIQAGKWLGEGLVIGIQKMESSVYASGSSLGRTATNTISSAISKISDTVNSDIDAQPTIRPVLDLSDVESGASAIGGLFADRTMSVSAQGVGSIAASMSARQNGATNSDVVSAIKALRKDISAMPRDSVSIGGITYSGDSDINNAVQALVRAAKVERRV